LLLLAMTLWLVAIMLRFRRSRRLQKALAAFLITSLILGPLLQSLKIRSVLDAQTAEAAAQDQQPQQTPIHPSLPPRGDKPAYTPHATPLAAADPPAYTADLPAGIAAAPLAATNVLATDNGTDSDQDGLTDFQEQRVGTDPTSADTDGDGVPDAVEA